MSGKYEKDRLIAESTVETKTRNSAKSLFVLQLMDKNLIKSGSKDGVSIDEPITNFVISELSLDFKTNFADRSKPAKKYRLKPSETDRTIDRLQRSRAINDEMKRLNSIYRLPDPKDPEARILDSIEIELETGIPKIIVDAFALIAIRLPNFAVQALRQSREAVGTNDSHTPDKLLNAAVEADSKIDRRADGVKAREKTIKDLQASALPSFTQPGATSFMVSDVDVNGNEKIRVATSNEAAIIQNKIGISGIPDAALAGQAAGKTYTYSAKNIKVVESNPGARLEILTTADKPAIDKKKEPESQKHLANHTRQFTGTLSNNGYIGEALSNILNGFAPIIWDNKGAREAFARSFFGDTVVSYFKKLASAVTAKRRADAVREATKSSLARRKKVLRDGIIPKDETIAILKIVQPLKNSGLYDKSTSQFEGAMRLVDISAPTTSPGFRTIFETDSFLLQNVEEVDAEKIQVVETFGEPIAFFYGRRPRFYHFTGVLLNTKDYLWRDSWKTAYENFLRGTKCVETRARAYLSYDFTIKEGFITNMAMSQTQNPINMVSLSFQMYVTREVNVQGREALLKDAKTLLENANALPADLEARAQEKIDSI